jgi:serine/threonine protein kinase
MSDIAPIKADIAALHRGELDLESLKSRVRDHLNEAQEDAGEVLQTLYEGKESGVLPEDAYEELTRFVGETFVPGTQESDPADNSFTRLATEQSFGDSGESSDVDVGMRLRNRFILDEVVGVGGMGTVYRGRDELKMEARDRDPRVAIKVLNDNFKRRPEAFIALQREASRQQRLAHPNIATVYDFDRSDGVVFISMEFLTGHTLDRFLKEEVIPKNGLPLEQILPILEGVCAALSHAHARNIVHADFKPGNCFITETGTIKVLDFGIARAMKDPHAPAGDQTLFDARSIGALTPAYASYEMISDSEDADPRDDIYALGCVTYELLTGKHPFHRIPADQAKANNLQPEKIKGLSRRQNEVLRKSLSFDRSERTPTVNHFLQEIKGGTRAGQAALVWSLAVIMVGVLVAAAFLVPSYLKERKFGTLVAQLQSTDRVQVNTGLDNLDQLPPDEIRRLLQESRQSLLAYFSAEVNRMAGVPDELVDYARVDDLLLNATQYYPDSVVLAEASLIYTQRKNAYLSDLSGLFDSYLAAQYLHPHEDGDDLQDLLARIRNVDANNALLTDSRIPGSYADAAVDALSRENYADARLLVDAGLAMFPDVSGLADINDQLSTIEQAIAYRQRVQNAAQTLESQVNAVQTLTELSGLQPAITDLTALEPEHEALRSSGSKLAKQLMPDIQAVLESNSLPNVVGFLNAYQNIWASLQQPDVRLDMLRKQSLLQDQQNGLVERIRSVILRADLIDTDGTGLTTLLSVLTSLDADDFRIANLHAQVVSEIRSRSQSFVDRANWESARSELSKAEIFAITGELKQSLGSDLARIESLEKIAGERLAEAERQQELDREAELTQAAQEQQLALERAYIEEIRQREKSVDVALENFIQAAPVESMRSVQAALRELQRVDAENGLLNTGDRQVKRLVVQALEQQNDLSNALILVGQVRTEIGDFLELTRLERGLQSQQRQEIVRTMQRKIAQALEVLHKALSDFGELETLAGRRDALNALTQLSQTAGVDQAVMQESIERYAMAHATAADTLIDRRRFSVAGEVLDFAARGAPDHRAIVSAQSRLIEQQAQFRLAREAQDRQARLVALEDLFRTEVNAAQLERALQTLEEYRSLDSSSAFATNQAQKLLLQAYELQARRLIARDELTNALAMIDEGSALQPGSIWGELRAEVEFKRLHLRILAWSQGSTRYELAAISEYKARIQAEHKADYPGLLNQWEQQAMAHLNGLRSETDKFDRFLTAAQTVLDDSSRVNRVQRITPPVREKVVIAKKPEVKKSDSSETTRPGTVVTQTVVAQPVVAQPVVTLPDEPRERQKPVVELAKTPAPKPLALRDISGQWCGDALNLTFSMDSMSFIVGKRRIKYDVTAYEYQTDMVSVKWRDRRAEMIFEFGTFADDGQSMTQLRGRRADEGDWQIYNRLLRRCG